MFLEFGLYVEGLEELFMAVEFKGVLLFQALWALNAVHVHRVLCLGSSGVCRLEASEALGFLVPKHAFCIWECLLRQGSRGRFLA